MQSYAANCDSLLMPLAALFLGPGVRTGKNFCILLLA